MKSILFIAFLAIATIGCDTPEKSTGSDTSAPPMTDTTATSTDTSTYRTDTTTTMPGDTTTSPNPTDTTKTQ